MCGTTRMGSSTADRISPRWVTTHLTDTCCSGSSRGATHVGKGAGQPREPASETVEFELDGLDFSAVRHR